MAADINDHFTHVALGTLAALQSPFTQDDPIAQCNDLSEWPTDTAVYFGMDKVSSATGERIDGSYSEYKGIVSGNNIGSLTFVGGTLQDYPAGQTTRVYMVITAAGQNELIDGILVSHNQDGTIKNNAVGNAQLSDSAVDTAELTDGAVTTVKRAQGTRKHNMVVQKRTVSGSGSSFPNSADSLVMLGFIVPDDYIASTDITCKIQVSGPTTGSCDFYRNVFRHRLNTSVSTIDSAVHSVISMTSPSTGAKIISFTIDDAGFQAGDIIRVEMHRDGPSGGDTASADAELDGAWFEYTGRQ